VGLTPLSKFRAQALGLQFGVISLKQTAGAKECEQLDLSRTVLKCLLVAWRRSIPCTTGLGNFGIWVVAFICIRVLPLQFNFRAPSPILSVPPVLNARKSFYLASGWHKRIPPGIRSVCE